MKHKVSYNESNKILNLSIIEYLSAADADELFSEASKSTGGQDNILVLYDLSGTASILPDSLEKLSSSIAAAGYKKLAVVCTSITESAKVFSKLLLSIQGMSESSSFFRTEKDAVDWLLS